MRIYVASFVVDISHALDAFPVRIRLRPPAGKNVLVIFCPFWRLVEEKSSRLGFLQQGSIVRSVGIGLLHLSGQRYGILRLQQWSGVRQLRIWGIRMGLVEAAPALYHCSLRVYSCIWKPSASPGLLPAYALNYEA